MYYLNTLSKFFLCVILLGLGLGEGTAHAFSSTGNNFTMVTPSAAPGTLANGGANNVLASWDGTVNTTSTGTQFNMTLSSTTPFFGVPWSAHDIRVFGPGTYTFNTGCTVTELETNGGATCAVAGTTLTMTVGPNQLGAHMLFDWNGNYNIDVANVWNVNSTFGPTPMYTAAYAPSGDTGGDPTTVWSFTTADSTGTGINGIPMVDGPFPGFRADFNLIFVAGGIDCTLTNTCPLPPPVVEVPDPNVGSRFGLGCSMSTKPINPLERGDWWLLLGLVAWMGFVIRRKRA
jgi:hypothetical protein